MPAWSWTPPRFAMQTLAADSSQPARVVPVGALLVTLLVAMGLSFWLLPSQTELADRLMRDQQYDEMVQAMGGSIPGTTKDDLRRLPREELAHLAAMLRLSPRERLRLIFSESNPPHYNAFLHALALRDVHFIDVVSPESAWRLVRGAATRIGSKQFTDLGTVIAHNALAMSRPELAADIFARLCVLPDSSAEIAQEMAVTHRWAGRSKAGAEMLHRWLDAHRAQLAPEPIKHLTRLGAELAEQGGDPSLALTIWKDDWTAPTSIEIDKGLALARQCNREKEVVPWLERALTATPEASLPLVQLHERAVKEPASLADYLSRVRMLAALADAHSLFDLAFDQHARLAAARDASSLDRCLSLSEFLGRDEETALLLQLDSQLLQTRPELTLRLAGMLGGLGRDAEAGALYKRWLDSHPDDSEAAYAYACLLEDEGDEDAALLALESLHRHHPQNVPALKKLAESYIRAGRQPKALALYESLPDENHDSHTLENYELLAESLDDAPHLFAAQCLRARRSGMVADYLDLAETAAALPDPTAALAILRSAIDKQPASAPLRVATASLLTLSGREPEAIEVLMHPSVRQHQRGMESLLQMEEARTAAARVIAFAGADVEKRFPLSPGARLDLAVLCCLSGQNARGEAIFESIPETPEALPDIAEARYEAGYLDEAASAMRRYVSRAPQAAPDDWLFLGDIYDAMGRTDDARNAYNQSITLLTSDLPNRTTSSLAWPKTPAPAPP